MPAEDRPLLHRTALLEVLDALSAQGRPAAVLLLDVDGSRTLVEQHGRATTGVLLGQLGDRLREIVHDGDAVAALGGDEFVVVCEHGVGAATALASDLCSAARRPLAVLGRDRRLTVSVGVAVFDGRSSTLRNLMAAGAAVRLAKERGRDRVEVFDEGLRSVALCTLARTTELRQAARLGQLRLHFQPVVDLGTGTMTGCEGLLRWEHPVRGVLPPADFLDVAEASGLLDDMTEDLIDQAARAAAELADGSCGPAPYVAVNLAARQLASPDLVAQVEAAVAEHQLPPGRLMVEITETTVLGDLERSLATLHGLRRLGVTIALDDFGTGYSSLLHLRRLPVDVVKIDRSFVSAIMRDREDLAIVAGVIDLAVRLGVRTTAEGVETPDQAMTLRELGCDAGQGYLWSPAVPVDDVRALQRAGSVATRGVSARDTTAQILRMHADGASPHTVAAALNALGARNDRGRRWHARTVLRVLSAASHPGLRAGQAQR